MLLFVQHRSADGEIQTEGVCEHSILMTLTTIAAIPIIKAAIHDTAIKLQITISKKEWDWPSLSSDSKDFGSGEG